MRLATDQQASRHCTAPRAANGDLDTSAHQHSLASLSHCHPAPHLHPGPDRHPYLIPYPHTDHPADIHFYAQAPSSNHPTNRYTGQRDCPVGTYEPPTANRQ